MWADQKILPKNPLSSLSLCLLDLSLSRLSTPHFSLSSLSRRLLRREDRRRPNWTSKAAKSRSTSLSSVSSTSTSISPPLSSVSSTSAPTNSSASLRRHRLGRLISSRTVDSSPGIPSIDFPLELEAAMEAKAINQTESIFRRCNVNQSVTGTANKQQVYNNMPKSLLRIVVVGDMHEEWNLVEDTLALQFLQPDLVLFTGDIGNENVELVRSVASLEMPKAVILGNHDSWGTQKFSTKIKDNIQLQLECLGEEHVGYSRLDFPKLKLSVVGGRPFSCGGEQLFRKKLLTKRYGIKDMDGSAKQISKAALGTPEDHLVILLAHNGPTGLGSNTNDICGRDWVDGGGDHGDPDLAQAISYLKETTQLCIPLVVFGHMHKELAHGNRKMTVAGDDNTMYVNGAIVPRVKKLVDEQGISNKGTMRAFTLVEFFNGGLSKIAETWVSVVGDQTTLEDEQIIFTIDEPSVL